MIDMRMAKILYHLSIPNQKCKIKIIISFAIISICLFPASKSDAVYPVTIDPVIVEMKKILAWDAEAEDRFGYSVAISGDTVVVGVPYEDTGSNIAGAVYIFARDQGGANNWGQVKKIVAWDAEARDYFGISVAISGDTVVVGVPWEDTGSNNAGAVYIFARDQGGANNWGQVKKIVAWDAEAYDYFGQSVAISGDTVVVGVPGEDTGSISAGAVYIFARDQGGANNWGQVKKIVAWDAEEEDHFGASVAINDDTVVVGVPLEDTASDNAGAVYIFVRDQGGANNWGQVKKIVAWDAEADDRFGYSVAISGDTVVVGVLYEDTGSNNAGAVYIFVRDQGGANNWGQVKKIVAWDAEADDRFGQSVAISGDTVVVGVPYEDTGSYDAGAAYIFARDQGGANNWGQVKKIVAWDAEAFDRFGYSVAISGDTVVMGVPYEDTGSYDAGAVYIARIADKESLKHTFPWILLLLMAN